MTDYCTVEEVRNYTGIASEELPDSIVSTMITAVTKDIDAKTGKTWQGVATASNEYYTGDGSDTLFLCRPNIIELLSIEIDDDDDGTYTTVTPSKVKVYKDEGILVLRDDAEVTTFPTYDKSTKVTYTYATATSSVPEDIKMLALDMVANLLHKDPARQERIDRKINELKFSGPMLV